jgi:hypothetical protein
MGFLSVLNIGLYVLYVALRIIARDTRGLKKITDNEYLKGFSWLSY